MPETPQETLSERVTRLRKQMGWNKKELAERAGLHPTHIGMIERSGRVGVRPETVEKLAEAFGISVARLLGKEESTGNDLEPYRQVFEAARVRNMEPDHLQELISFRLAIEAAKGHGLDPDQLLQLINTMADMFAKK